MYWIHVIEMYAFQYVCNMKVGSWKVSLIIHTYKRGKVVLPVTNNYFPWLQPLNTAKLTRTASKCCHNAPLANKNSRFCVLWIYIPGRITVIAMGWYHDSKTFINLEQDKRPHSWRHKWNSWKRTAPPSEQLVLYVRTRNRTVRGQLAELQ